LKSSITPGITGSERKNILLQRLHAAMNMKEAFHKIIENKDYRDHTVFEVYLYQEYFILLIKT
jgi:hypothetical protein